MIHRRYNKNKKCYVELEEGEQFCPKCDGSGRVPKRNGKYASIRFAAELNCDKCLGDGKIDWIERATGKKQKQIYGFET